MATFVNNGFRVHRRRAMVVVQVGIMMVVLLGFGALTLDLGSLFLVRGDLQRSADAAALAGASVYTSDDMMRIRQGTGSSATLASVLATADARATSLAAVNPSFGTSTTLIDSGDIVSGRLDLNSATSPVETNPQPRDYNAVRVIVRRNITEGGGGNGGVRYFFAPIFGMMLGETGAGATAVFDDRFVGFDTDVPGAGIAPFTISEDAFYQELNNGGDSYGYDETSGTVFSAGDGIREIRLYPYPLSGAGYTEGDGNFGMLNIGEVGQGSAEEANQILNGVSPEQLAAEIGTSDPSFFDSGGNTVTYDITGSPGLTASLKDVLGQMIGEVVGFFLHDGVILSGATAVYTIKTLRFGRVMDVRLTGPPNQRGIFIQPVSYSGGGVRLDPSAPSSDGLVGVLVLAR